jgi:hypothetical protein
MHAFSVRIVANLNKSAYCWCVSHQQQFLHRLETGHRRSWKPLFAAHVAPTTLGSRGLFFLEQRIPWSWLSLGRAYPTALTGNLLSASVPTASPARAPPTRAPRALARHAHPQAPCINKFSDTPDHPPAKTRASTIPRVQIGSKKHQTIDNFLIINAICIHMPPKNYSSRNRSKTHSNI